METKHTKGKWVIHEGLTPPVFNPNKKPFLITSRSGHIAIVPQDWISDEMNQANVKLIASAPELLEVLISVMDCDWDAVRSQQHNPFKGLIKQVIKKATE